jgi:hypothetical protein
MLSWPSNTVSRFTCRTSPQLVPTPSSWPGTRPRSSRTSSDVPARSDTIELETYGDPLAAVRRVLQGADEVLLGVAFVQQRGVNLLEPQLRTVGSSRLITTTVFGSTTSQGLEAARTGGLGVRVLNPSRGTFHPKLYLARHGDRIAAATGSANLTSGLVANVEVVAVIQGHRGVSNLETLWAAAESWWDHQEAFDWAPGEVAAPAEVLDPTLLRSIAVAAPVSSEISTLGPDPKPNWITEITPDGVWVETLSSRAKGRAPQLVEASMIQAAWDYLAAHGSLTNRYLLRTQPVHEHSAEHHRDALGSLARRLGRHRRRDWHPACNNGGPTARRAPDDSSGLEPDVIRRGHLRLHLHRHPL